MNNDLIVSIQKRILDLLPAELRKQPGIFLADSCSEVSRLVAAWIKKIDDSSIITIFKGNEVCGTKKAHDVLVVQNGNIFYVIDPTIWQFFPEENSILISISVDLDGAIKSIQAKYGGYWQKSEDFTKLDSVEESNYVNIIVQNIKEALGK